MKKYLYEIFKIFVFSLLISLFIPSVLGAYKDKQVFRFNLTSNFNDELESWDFTNSGITFSGSGADFEATESDSASNSAKYLLANNTDFSYCTNVKPESLTGTMVLYSDHEDATSKGYILRIADSTGYKFNVWADSTSSYYTTNTLSAGTWYKFCHTFNASNNQNRMYFNSNTTINTFTNDISYTSGTAGTYFGRYDHVASAFYDGMMNDTCGWKRVLTNTDIGSYMKFGCDGAVSAPITQTPTPTNLINTSAGIYNITLNFTIKSGSYYLLYQNGTNVINFTTIPYIRTNLTNNTRYGFKIKSYNSTYTIPLSNFSNLVETRTRQTEQFIPTPEVNDTFLLLEINRTLGITNENLIEINEAIGMLWIVSLYLVIIIFGIALLYMGNYYGALGMFTISVAFDLMFIVKLLDEYFFPNFAETWQGSFYIVGSTILTLWLFIKLYILVSVKRHNSINIHKHYR